MNPFDAITGAGQDQTPQDVLASVVPATSLEDITKDFKRLQKQKARKTGGVESRILSNCAFVWGEHYVSQHSKGLVAEPLDPNKLYLVFNLIDHRLSKTLGRLSSVAPTFKARPDKKDAKAAAEAEVVDKLIVALDEKLDQPSITWQELWWMAVGGVVFERTAWIPNSTMEPTPQFDQNNELLFKNVQTEQILPESAKNQAVAAGDMEEHWDIYEEIESQGDVGAEVLSPLQVFMDQSVKSVADLAPDQAIYVADIKTKGWIEENFGEQPDLEPDKELKIVTTSLFQDGDATASLFLKDLIPLFQGQLTEDDLDMNVVVERYQPASTKNPHGKLTIFVPGKKILFDDDNPYPEIPITDIHWSPVTTTFWTKDYVTDLIAPQRFINKRISQLGEQANASIYDKLLLGGSLTAKDIPSDFPGVIQGAVEDGGAPLVQRLPGPQLPGWFLESIDIVTKLFNDIAGGGDLFQQEKFPGQLRGPMAVPMLQEILDSEQGPRYMHIGERMARIKQMRLNRVKQFYPPIRTLHYTDTDQRDEVLVFHTDKLLKSGTNYNVTVERGSLVPELKAMNEAKVRERLASPLGILYTDERTGRLDKTKIAQDLKMGDSSRESREAQARTFQGQIIDRLWKGEPVPPVAQFWDHEPMLDELEASMMTTEFLSASPQIQQIFMDRWQQHVTILQQRAEAQQASIMNQMVHSAVAQATQQAAAQAASEAAQSAIEQVKANAEAARQQEAQRMAQMTQAVSPPPQFGGPPRPQMTSPQRFTKPPIKK